jgi:importin subunit beta-1
MRKCARRSRGSLSSAPFRDALPRAFCTRPFVLLLTLDVSSAGLTGSLVADATVRALQQNLWSSLYFLLSLPRILALLTSVGQCRNKCMSATVCLINISRCVKDKILDLVQHFIKTNVNKRGSPEDWRCREAALTAFGCIVDGPDRDKHLPFVVEAFGFLLEQALGDEHPMVRRTTLWTLGRIFEHLHTPETHPQLVTQDNVGAIVGALLRAMAMDHSMALKACYAIQQLADGFSPADERHELTPFFPQIAEELLKVAYSSVPADHAAALHVTAFEAMHTLIANSAQESIEFVTQMTPHFLKLIEQSLVAVDGDKALLQKRNELQGQLCAALQVRVIVVTRVTSGRIPPFAVSNATCCTWI